jgi:hypothetical protein
MSKVGDAVNKARTKVAAKSARIFPDTCDLWGPTFIDGGAVGDSETIAPIPLATNIPIGYKGSSANSQVVVGGEAYSASHRLKMPRTSTTLTITPKHLIKVQARGDTSELVFEKPVIVQKDTDVFLTLAATLVQQGFQ